MRIAYEIPFFLRDRLFCLLPSVLVNEAVAFQFQGESKNKLTESSSFLRQLSLQPQQTQNYAVRSTSRTQHHLTMMGPTCLALLLPTRKFVPCRRFPWYICTVHCSTVYVQLTYFCNGSCRKVPKEKQSDFAVSNSVERKNKYRNLQLHAWVKDMCCGVALPTLQSAIE